MDTINTLAGVAYVIWTKSVHWVSFWVVLTMCSMNIFVIVILHLKQSWLCYQIVLFQHNY